MDNWSLLSSTAQSNVYLDKDKRLVLKKFKTPNSELKAYRIIKNLGCISLPTIVEENEDYMIFEYLESEGVCSDEEIVKNISRLYFSSWEIFADLPVINTSREKVVTRLSYFPEELEKRGVKSKNILSKCHDFLASEFIEPTQRCLVHGDLKISHVIKNKGNVFFIDWGNCCSANPYYDLAFLVMNHHEDAQALNRISRLATEYLGQNIEMSVQLLKSMVFYRALYDVIYALRHRSDTTLQRTIKYLEDLI